MSKTKVVNVKVAHIRPEYNNLAEWMARGDNYYIGRKGIVFINKERFPKRDSPFANPFVVDKNDPDSRDKIIRKYEKYIRKKVENGEVDIDALRGKVLGCWCKPLECHGDVLLKILGEHDGVDSGTVTIIMKKEKIVGMYTTIESLKKAVEDKFNGMSLKEFKGEPPKDYSFIEIVPDQYIA